MIKMLLHKNLSFISLLICCLFAFPALSFKNNHVKPGILIIKFINRANDKMIFLRDSVYKNSFGEEYTISKLKYYIGRVSVPGSQIYKENDFYHLINAADSDNSFRISVDPGSYKSIQFLLGVDSLSNCSGAQSGALDPVNDMFWTWNSGYVMFKLEGTSAASTADLQRIEHHVGGFKGKDNNYCILNRMVLLPLLLRQTWIITGKVFQK